MTVILRLTHNKGYGWDRDTEGGPLSKVGTGDVSPSEVSK